jgi:hypothetical protein
MGPASASHHTSAGRVPRPEPRRITTPPAPEERTLGPQTRGPPSGTRRRVTSGPYARGLIRHQHRDKLQARQTTVTSIDFTTTLPDGQTARSQVGMAWPGEPSREKSEEREGQGKDDGQPYL